ncbi:MAG: acid phosphatase type 7 [Patescibacteria group bacterium]|nr:acid phosphatase type 7 [Patescibacteria group bacterium]
MKFNLDSLEGKTITAAKLKVKVANASSATQRIRLAKSSDWEESNLTFDNKPGVYSDFVSFNGGKSDQTVSVDVTPLILKREGKRATLVIDTDQNNGFDIYSREHDSKPELVVTYQ